LVTKLQPNGSICSAMGDDDRSRQAEHRVGAWVGWAAAPVGCPAILIRTFRSTSAPQEALVLTRRG
jgi:hypothetical protein